VSGCPLLSWHAHITAKKNLEQVILEIDVSSESLMVVAEFTARQPSMRLLACL
jgi:hypothetical protein